MIDDNERILVLAAQILSHAGFVPSIVPSGRRALSLLNKCVFDAIIVDFFMPGMTGDELVRAVRGHRNPAVSKVPVLGLSGSCKTDALFVRSGANACIHKPLQERRLLSAVRRLLPAAAAAHVAT